MPDPRQLDPDPIRVVLDQGEVVELDGGTLVLDGRGIPERGAPACALACTVSCSGAAGVVVSVADLPPPDSTAPG